MPKPSITVYYTPQTRCDRVIWTLEELTIEYTIKLIALSSKNQKSEEYLNINPYGLVPAIEDSGRAIYESGAICMYLVDKYGQGKLAPSIDNETRGLYYQFILSLPANIEPPFVNALAAQLKEPSIDFNSTVPGEVKAIISNLTILEKHLKQNQYSCGDEFTVADIVVGACLLFSKRCNLFFLSSKTLDNYLAKLTERPAYKKTVAIEQQYLQVFKSKL